MEIVKYLENLTKEERNILFKKIWDKYNSEKYKESEYRQGYEPRVVLYDYILEYAEKHGKQEEPEECLIFCVAKYIIDDSWIIRLLIGQGAFITFSPIDNDYYRFKYYINTETDEIYQLMESDDFPGEEFQEITKSEYDRLWIAKVCPPKKNFELKDRNTECLGCEIIELCCNTRNDNDPGICEEWLDKKYSLKWKSKN